MTAILEKDGMTAFIGYRPCCGCGKFISVMSDPRMPTPAMAQQDTLEIAERNFRGGVARSVKRGWRLIFAGEPNRG
jgi:hypothetical protein